MNDQKVTAKCEDGKRYSRPRAVLLAVFATVILLTALFFLQTGAFGKPAVPYSPRQKVLVYHLISDSTYGENEYLFVRPEDFEKQLMAIREGGYQTVFADEPIPNPEENYVMLTFDDGYADNFTTLLPLLEKYDMKATVFLITDMIGTEGYLTEGEIREMAKSGHIRFGSHTVTHTRAAGADREQLRKELTESRRRIESLTGERVYAFAYPNGSYDDAARRAAAEAGYLYCYTTDAPREMVYENTKLPRSYVVRDMPMEEFLSLLK